MSVASAREFLIQELSDIYSAENQLIEALPKMSEAASHAELKSALDEHLEQTRGQVERLNRIFAEIGAESSGETCEAMKGLVTEAEELIEEISVPEILDAALIGAAQKVEHYEIAAYGTLASIADAMGLEDVGAMLDETLEEEKQADARLTDLAETEVNPRMVEAAAAAGGEGPQE